VNLSKVKRTTRKQGKKEGGEKKYPFKAREGGGGEPKKKRASLLGRGDFPLIKGRGKGGVGEKASPQAKNKKRKDTFPPSASGGGKKEILPPPKRKEGSPSRKRINQESHQREG